MPGIAAARRILNRVRAALFRFGWVTGIGLGSFALLAGGCASAVPGPVAKGATPAPELQKLNPGDVIKISFPSAPNLDTTQQIRRDGRINLYMAGEVIAATKTPAELENELVAVLAPQLVSKEVRVTIVSASFSVFVTGAVMRPGKIAPDRAVTALEAIMEAGGFDDTKADKKSVRVIRTENGVTMNFTLDLKAAIEGAATAPFYLKSYDILYVPEKFSWF